MEPHRLLATYVPIRWLVEPKRLSEEQLRVLRGAIRRGEPLALSAISLLEIGVLFGEGNTRLRVTIKELLTAFESDAPFYTIPIDVKIAAEVAALGGALRDPADRAIVATARVHGLHLVTSDQRIIESKLVAVVE